jgi:hypothetical protein
MMPQPVQLSLDDLAAMGPEESYLVLSPTFGARAGRIFRQV